MTEQKFTSLEGVQIGGTHYKGMAIEPAVYCQKNGLKCCESEAIIYLSRHQRKNGAEDIKKAIHFCMMILEMEYGIKTLSLLFSDGPSELSSDDISDDGEE